MKSKEILKLNKTEREKKLKDLRMELVKARASKENNSKPREIRKMIARILTLNNAESKKSAEVGNQ